jgi:signal transduction histidine kinase
VLGIRRIVQPLRQLRLQARLAATGDLSALAQPVNGIEEIEELQQTLTSLSEQVKREQNRQRDYAHALRDAQENERKRLAHELHDVTIQDLIALSQRLQIASIAARKTRTAEPGVLDDLRSQVLRMIDDVRQFSRALRPIYLEEAGLLAALERLTSEAADVGRTASPAYRVVFSGTMSAARQPPELELMVYRIAQEALNNAIKHAHATQIEMLFDARAATLRLTVSDNGCGFDSKNMPHGMGLIGMRERAKSNGARLDLRSAPRAGTQIELTLPGIPG